MPRSKSTAATTSEPLSIEQLQKQYHELNEQKIRAAAQLESAAGRLDDLRKEAQEKYGTNDLAELQKKLEEMRAENESKRQKYQAGLEAIQAALAAVEESFAGDASAENEDA